MFNGWDNQYLTSIMYHTEYITNNEACKGLEFLYKWEVASYLGIHVVIEALVL